MASTRLRTAAEQMEVDMYHSSRGTKCVMLYTFAAAQALAWSPLGASVGSSKSAAANAAKCTVRPRLSSATRFVQCIPIHISGSASTIPSGQQLYCTVTVQSVPCDGGYVQINCDTPSALSNSSGSWPLSVYFPPGSSTTGNFTLTANSVSTNVGLYYGTSDANPDDPADWTEGATVTITAG
jgi:hypothetical protein